MTAKARFRLIVCISIIASLSLSQAAYRPAYKVVQSWDKGFKAEVKVGIRRSSNKGWKLRFRFARPLEKFECWSGIVTNTALEGAQTEFQITNKSHNGILRTGNMFTFTFLASFPPDTTNPVPPPVTVVFQNRILYQSRHFVAATTTPPLSLPTTDIMYIINKLKEMNRTSEAPNNKDDSSSINNLLQIDNNNNQSYVAINGSYNNPKHLTNEEINRRNEEINRRNEEINRQNNLRNKLNLTEDTSEGSGEIVQITEMSTSRSTVSSPPTQEAPISLTSTTTTTTTRLKPVPVENATGKYDYAKVIRLSLLFYEAQRSGRLPSNKRIKWTRSSGLQDRGTKGEDLSGGYYDAGDYIKFGFPMAFSVTLLAWGVIEYWDVYEAIGELQNALDALKWGADYFIKAHVSPFELYGQVGDPQAEHKRWGSPDIIPNNRPAYKITKQNPGSDLAGETSAALSAVSLAFRRLANGQTTSYVEELVTHAHDLYIFARNFQKKYDASIPKAAKYYPSSNFKDEITWAAAWLYRATGDEKFLAAAEGQYQNWVLFKTPKHLAFSWDDKRIGLQLLLSQISDKYKRRYEGTVKKYCQIMRTSTRVNRTRAGLVYLSDWSPLRYAANSAFICLMAGESGIQEKQNLYWGAFQINYMLGDSGRSYVVGFGKKYPKKPHHRASSCPPRPVQCERSHFESKKPNPMVLRGALVGGPDRRDHFKDSRKDYKQSEVALDHNAGFQGALAALQYHVMFPNAELSRSHEPWYKNKQTPDATSKPKSNSYLFRSSSNRVFALSFLSLFISTLLCNKLF